MMHGFGFGLSGFIGMVLVWILLIAGAVWLIKQIFSGQTNQPRISAGEEDRAMDILKKRYARGEINREEFESIKSDLRD